MTLRPRILILYTGGTFGMDAEPLVIPKLSPKSLERRLRDRVPELESLAQCSVHVEMNRDSAHVGPDEWLQIAATLKREWKHFDGFVILHGTDTLAYTASALSFLIRPCMKPVILTGAQRPLAAIRSDARRNLISAVEIAARSSRERRHHDVSVFFNDAWFQGNRARKRSAVDYAGFESPKAPILARVGTSIQFFGGDREQRTAKTRKSSPNRSPALAARFSRRVAMVHLTPGFPAASLRLALDQLDGLLLVAFPSGTAPTQDSGLHELIRAARETALPVMVVTEGIGVTGSEYRAGKELLESGCLWSGAMTPECAYVKASLLLGQPRGRDMLRQLWTTDLAGEGAAER